MNQRGADLEAQKEQRAGDLYQREAALNHGQRGIEIQQIAAEERKKEFSQRERNAAKREEDLFVRELDVANRQQRLTNQEADLDKLQ